jgi:hypothetical protein
MRDQSERRALAAKYRQQAEEANEWAAKSTTQTLRDEYLRLAIGWVQLADSVEGRSSGGEP